MIVREKAFAKINLTLEVLNRRDDGYHDLRSIMTCAALYDSITVESGMDNGITLSCDDASMPEGPKNLAYRAAEVFFAESDCLNDGVHITLQKRIPSQAGMGGGSADAAAVLRALRKIYTPTMSDCQLERMAEQLGSDVPFCVKGGTQLAEGRGERLSTVSPLPKCWFVLVKPDISHSTAAMYTALDRCTNCDPPTTDEMIKALESGDLKKISPLIHNDFEQALSQSSPVRNIIMRLRIGGAMAAAMTGSGSAVFGIYQSGIRARLAAMQLRGDGVRTFAVPRV